MNIEHILSSLETLLEGHLGNPKEKTSVDVLLDEEVSKNNEIVLYNDDVNTFDHVIDTLIYACDHTPEQAEQCTLMIHYKGKCCVKHGDWDKLVAMRNAICERGLSAEVE